MWHGPALALPSAGPRPAPASPASGLADRVPREEVGLEGRYGIGPLSLSFHGLALEALELVLEGVRLGGVLLRRFDRLQNLDVVVVRGDVRALLGAGGRGPRPGPLAIPGVGRELCEERERERE